MTNTRVAELINQNNFVSILKNELYALIDEELAKDTEMDCDLIDELVNAIEALEQCEDENPAVVLPLIFADGTLLSKRIRNKVNGKKTLMRITALAAAFAMILSGANQIPTSEGKSVLVYAVDEFLEGIGEIFGIEKLLEKEETPTTPEIEESTTTPEKVEEEIKEQSKEPIATAPEIVSIGLITYGSFKSSYLWKEELDLTGLKVVAVYSDDTEKVIPVSDCEISGFNSLKLGEQLVTVKYKGVSAFFKVTVSKTEQNNAETRKITNIECNVTGKDVIVPKGTENPAIANNVKYRYVYSDGTFSPWTACKDAELVSEYDSELIDTPQTLTYQAPNGMTFTINVIVYDNTVPEELKVIRLEVSGIPKAMKYYPTNLYKCYTYVGEEVDFTQFELKVTYEDGSFKHKTLADSKIQAFGTMTTDRPSSYKGYTITFAYGDATVDFKYDVLIKPEIQAWFVDETRWDVYYVNEAPQEYNASTLVTANMTDSNERIYLDVEVKGYDPNKIGYIELEIYYNGEKLCDYISGFIYGDTGFAVTSRPITDAEALPSKLNHTPYVIANKCIGNGNFETYADIKDQLKGGIVDDPNQYYQSTTAGELKAMGISSFSVRCIDHAIVEYKIRADQKITEIGTHTAQVYLYNTKTNDNGWSYQRDGIAQDLSYTTTIKEQPVKYEVDAPNNIKINIQDIYSEFYDKLHVYAVYEDGRKEEIFDYTVKRYSPSLETTSSRLDIFIRCPSGNGQYRQVYIYSDGYEDSFFITVSDYRKEKENYYAVGEKVPAVDVVFSSAKREDLDSFYTTETATHILEKWDIEGWDTSTPGEKEATIIYHSPIGDLKTTYKYIVIPEYLEPTCTIVFNEGVVYDIRYGLVKDTYKVIYTDRVGKTHEITDYMVSYNNNSTITVHVKNPYNPIYEETYFVDIENAVGRCENFKAEKLEDGSIKITADCPYYPENGTMKFYLSYPTGKGQYGTVYKTIKSSTPEFIITPEMLQSGIDVARFEFRAYIVDKNTHSEYKVYTKVIDFSLV